MKKKYLIVILAILFCFTLVGCGKKEEDGEESKENIPELKTASIDNYEVLLKGHFGIDAKEIEEMGFTVKEVLGTEEGEKKGFYISPNFMIVYYDVSPEILSQPGYSTKMAEMFFNLAKKISDGKIYGYDSVEKDGKNGKIITMEISDRAYTNYDDYYENEEDIITWFYKKNGKTYYMIVQDEDGILNVWFCKK